MSLNLRAVPVGHSSLSYLFAPLPLSKDEVKNDPDYGALTQFCTTVHQRIGVDFVCPYREHSQTLKEFYLDYLEEEYTGCFEVEYSDLNYPKGDSRRYEPTFTPPNGDTARRCGYRPPDLFIEPGDPIRYWAYWLPDGDIELEGKYSIDNAVSPLEYQLSRVLGIDPENKL